jgi:uncharacterized membrane protein
MLQTATLIRLVQEIVMAMLGLLLIRVAYMGQFLWNPQSEIWIALGALLFVLGLREWIRAGRYAKKWEHRVRGASLVLVGLCMLAITFARMTWVAPLLATAGGVLTARGIALAALVARTR